jgi:hypothetical protein
LPFSTSAYARTPQGSDRVVVIVVVVVMVLRRVNIGRNYISRGGESQGVDLRYGHEYGQKRKPRKLVDLICDNQIPTKRGFHEQVYHFRICKSDI